MNVPILRVDNIDLCMDNCYPGVLPPRSLASKTMIIA